MLLIAVSIATNSAVSRVWSLEILFCNAVMLVLMPVISDVMLFSSLASKPVLLLTAVK